MAKYKPSTTGPEQNSFIFTKEPDPYSSSVITANTTS